MDYIYMYGLYIYMGYIWVIYGLSMGCIQVISHIQAVGNVS